MEQSTNLLELNRIYQITALNGGSRTIPAIYIGQSSDTLLGITYEQFVHKNREQQAPQITSIMTDNLFTDGETVSWIDISRLFTMVEDYNERRTAELTAILEGAHA